MTWNEGELSFAWMTQRLPAFSEPIANRANAAAALGVPDSAVGGTGLPVQVVSCGVPFVLVPLTTRRAVDNAMIDREALNTLHAPGRAATRTACFCFRPSAAPTRRRPTAACSRRRLASTKIRRRASRAARSACYLVRHKIVPAAKAGAMLSLQGVKMGRPSHVHISIGAEGTEIRSVRVGGESVLAGEGVLYIP